MTTVETRTECGAQPEDLFGVESAEDGVPEERDDECADEDAECEESEQECVPGE